MSASSPIGKRKSDNNVIYIICLIVVLYLALHSAICWESTLQMVSSGQIIEKDKLFTFIQLLTERLNSNPMDIQTNAYTVLWSSIFVTLMANKIGGLQFGIYRNCQISSRVFHTAVAALPLTKANRSDFE